MPEDIGEAVTVEKVQNYISMRGRFNYAWAKTEGSPASASGFNFTDATLFFAGPFGKNFGAFFELEREAADDIGLQANIVAAWGTEKSFGGLRGGEMHWLLRDGVAGFDRPTGLATPLPVSSPLTSGGLPFKFSRDQRGVEAFYVTGQNRISAEVLDGVNPNGGIDGGDADKRKDFVVTDQLLFDEAGSGLTAVGYYGTVGGADALASTVNSHFWRLALSANKFIDNLEVLGTVVYGKDTDLPVLVGGQFAKTDIKGLGYWVYGGYTFRKPGTEVEESPTAPTVFGRFEFKDGDTDISDNALRRFVVGGVLPVNVPQYLRLALEYTLDSPQGGLPKRSGVTSEVMLNF
jgi:hypothetical protein